MVTFFAVLAVLLAQLQVLAHGTHTELEVPGLGRILGTQSSEAPGVVNFLGVPYAKPPVGKLRFRSPQPHGPWGSLLNATAFGSACMGAGIDVANRTSENCLFLNVFKPLSATKLPVLVWLHGGSFVAGASNAYPGDAMLHAANNSAVVVTLNYRLNAFGFLGASVLRVFTADGSTGNLGIDDQRLALQWVKAHIAAFGGNANSVTIFGASAGGVAGLNHLVQPASVRLFHNVVVQSGAFPYAMPLNESEATFRQVLQSAHCKDVQCLLKLSAEDLLAAAADVKWFGPVVDDIALKASPEALIRRGEYNRHAPVIIGSNRDEYSFLAILMWHWPKNMSKAEFDTKLAANFDSPTRARLMEIYDASNYTYPSSRGNYSQWWWMAMRIATDGGWPTHGAFGVPLGHCRTRHVARALAGSGSSVYVYSFAHPPQLRIAHPNIPATGPGNVVVPHGSELPYVFGETRRLQITNEKELARTVATYWARFASTGNPNGIGSTNWPVYDSNTDEIIQLSIGSDGITKQHALRKEACDFWDQHRYGPFSRTSYQGSITLVV